MKRNSLFEALGKPIPSPDPVKSGKIATFAGWALWLVALFAPVYSTRYGNWNSSVPGWQVFLIFVQPGTWYIAAIVLACNATVLVSPFCFSGALNDARLVKGVGLLSVVLTLLIIPVSRVFVGIGYGSLKWGCFCWGCAILLVAWGCSRISAGNRP